jgi:hypothetical protein
MARTLFRQRRVRSAERGGRREGSVSWLDSVAAVRVAQHLVQGVGLPGLDRDRVAVADLMEA